MYDVEHPAHKKLVEIGREVTTKVKPRAVVVFSAHWQGGRDTIYVNTAEMTDLIYEYAVIRPWFVFEWWLMWVTAASMASLTITTRKGTPMSGAKK